MGGIENVGTSRDLEASTVVTSIFPVTRVSFTRESSTTVAVCCHGSAEGTDESGKPQEWWMLTSDHGVECLHMCCEVACVCTAHPETCTCVKGRC